QSGSSIQPPQGKAVRQGNTGKLISAHYLEIEYLLNRVENSLTHYQTLGIERSASNEDIILAYHNTISVLHPSYYKIRAAFPDEMLMRIDETFNKVSEAFSVLTNQRKRAEYDKGFHRPAYTPLPFDATKAHPIKERRAQQPVAGSNQHAVEAGNHETISIEASLGQQPAFTKPWSEEAAINRRRYERFKLCVPALITGHDSANGRWQEVAKTVDVSRRGVALSMKKHVRHGAVMHVTLPLPTKFRSHGFSEPGYNMYAIARRVEPPKDGVRIVGLEFIGANPPAGYLHKPWATFRTQKWSGPDRRREPRFERVEPVVIEYLNNSHQSVGKEVAFTENVSISGARVTVNAAPEEFDMVRIISADRSFESLALLRNQFAASDGLERLCLQFLDNKWPV
ncbi:MAG TPA: DnaJ domain-containing protein, partial [Blastocatellia bacterium]|nr:DnaJ domain-containing protein [Blastocatellia bacterium]